MSSTALRTAPLSYFPDDVEGIYKEHHRRVYAICLRMTGNVSEAEDLTQDVFIQVARKLSSFRGDSAFTTWLHRLTVNQVLMHFRRSSYRCEGHTDAVKIPDRVDSNTLNVVDRIALERAIPKLPRCYRMAFVLHDVEGYEHHEIAEMLEINIGTSKSNLHKARLKLRDILNGKAS